MKTVTLAGLYTSTHHGPVHLAGFPGWTGPVLDAIRPAVGGPYRSPLVTDLEVASVMLDARAVGLKARMASIVEVARIDGATMGLAVFTATLEVMTAELEQDPDLGMNVVRILQRFEIAAGEMNRTCVGDGALNQAGLALWCAARQSLGGEVVKLLRRVITDVAATAGQPELAEAWSRNLDEVVLAFVFPDQDGEPKSEEWKRRRIGRFEAIRAAVLAAL